MDPLGQKPIEGQPSAVEVPSNEALPKATEQLNQAQPVEQAGTVPVLNKPEVGVPKEKAQPVQNTAPVENEEQTRARLGNILDHELYRADTLAKLVGDIQDKK
ncbi:MAG: hypothetical protein Q7K11_00425 [Candidatus Berkelbacteria bacterium]|nr:hypothetical protein [Candidatus Berkelbacteria bacterium]